MTIAGARLDLQMGLLWHHLDRSVSLEVSRSKPAAVQSDKVRGLVRDRLVGDLATAVDAALDAADAAREHRNAVVHQDWVLRGHDGMRPVAEYLALAPEERTAYVEEWDREAKASEDWQRVPARSVDVVPAQTFENLRQVERELADAIDAITTLTFRVASSRETGSPPGYVRT